jgi:hypothetical protein
LLSPSERLEIVNKYEPSNNEIGKIFFGLQREKLFTEPMPDADEPWKPFEGLTVEKVVPIFIDMLLNMQKQIQLIENSNSIRKNNNAEPIIQENDYDFTDIHLRNLLDKIKFNKQIVEINISDSGLSFMSAGTDPYFFLPKSLFVKNMRAIRIEISAPENTTFQLFHKTGAFKPYIESNSVRRHLQAGRNTVILSLPVQGFKGTLRIDPGCHVGKYIIHKFEISF